MHLNPLTRERTVLLVGRSGSVCEPISDGPSQLLDGIDNSPKLTIAAINDPAFGGGNGLAFVCDIKINVKYAKFALLEVRLGLCPAPISIQNM